MPSRKRSPTDPWGSQTIKLVNGKQTTMRQHADELSREWANYRSAISNPKSRKMAAQAVSRDLYANIDAVVNGEYTNKVLDGLTRAKIVTKQQKHELYALRNLYNDYKDDIRSGNDAVEGFIRKAGDISSAGVKSLKKLWKVWTTSDRGANKVYSVSGKSSSSPPPPPPPSNPPSAKTAKKKRKITRRIQENDVADYPDARPWHTKQARRGRPIGPPERAIRRVLTQANFDSTRGYPGEGPNNRGNRRRVKRAVPARVDTVVLGRRPRVNYHSNGMTINHSEEIMDIYGTTSFGSTTIEFNPGLATISDWLAAKARGFDFYKVNSMSLTYVNSKGTSVDGRVALCADYDAHEVGPTTMRMCSNMEDSCIGNPGLPFSLRLKPKLLKGRQKNYFVRPDAVPTDGDRALFDAVTLHISTDDCADTSFLGTLQISYSITFSGQSMLNANIGKVYGGEITANGSITKTAPLGVTPTIDADALGITAYDNSGTSAISIANPGLYIIVLYCTGVGQSACSSSVTNGTKSEIHGFQADSGGVEGQITYSILSTASHGNPSVFTFSYTATSVTGGLALVASIPTNSTALAAIQRMRPATARNLPAPPKTMFGSLASKFKEEQLIEQVREEDEARRIQEATRIRQERDALDRKLDDVSSQSSSSSWLKIKG